MAIWEESYLSNEAWSLLRQALQILDEFTIGPEQEHRQARMVSAISAMIGRAKHPEILVSDSALASLSRQSQNLVQALTNWSSSSGANYFDEAYTIATDTLVDVIAHWPATKSAAARSASSEIIEAQHSLTAESDRVIQQLNEALDNFNTQLSKTMGSFDERVRQSVATFDDRVVAATTKMEEIRTEVENLRTLANSIKEQSDRDVTRVDTLITKASTDFANTSGERQSAFDSRVRSYDKIIDDLAIEGREMFLAREAALAEDAQGILDRILEVERKAKKTAEATGVLVTATDFASTATNESRTANWLRAGAIGCFIVSLAVGLALFFRYHDDSLDWQIAVQRFVLTIGVAGLGAYLVSESNKHRSNADDAKDTQLRLSTIEAFVTNLPPVIRDQVLTAAAYKVYVDKNMEWQSPTYDQMMAAIEKEAQSQKSP